MNLQDKIDAYWTDFGLAHCNELYNFQKNLAQLRLENKIPDIIIFSEHHPVISFGRALKNNRFSRNFLEKVKKIYDNDNEESCIDCLNKLGIDFFKEARGGGATYLGPGKLITYPIVDFHKIVNTTLGVNKYKNLIDQIMYEILKEKFNLNVNLVEISKEKKFNEKNEIVKNRADVWLFKNGKNYKIGATGIHTSSNISYNGFSMFVKQHSLFGFDFIDICGYNKNELDVTCMENELKTEINIYELRNAILDKIKEKFNYKNLVYIEPEDLEKIEVNSNLLISSD